MKITLDLQQLLLQSHPQHSPQYGAYQSLLSYVIPPFIKLLLEHTHGNKSAAARLAGISRATLDRRIKHYNIILEKTVSLPKEEV